MMETASNLPLPDAFLTFLKENDLDPSIYFANNSVPRYIRVKPGRGVQIQEIEGQINCELKKVGWLPNFYSLPPHVQIASSKAYREGEIYGIDASSGAAVMALNISPGDHVLDLCAAPGAKLCMILDLLGDSGSVTAVDVARHRLTACRTMLQKYALGDRCRLFVADGATFSLPPIRADSVSRKCESASAIETNSFREWTSKRPWKERKRASKERKISPSQLAARVTDPELIFYGHDSGVVGRTRDEVFRAIDFDEACGCGYDKVLVDAECTHDGSIKHVQKFEQWGWQTLQRRVLDAERTDTLTALQFQLLSNGFRLLKVGGSLVYSTCSLTVAQNEDVVEKFLLQNASCELQEIDSSNYWPCKGGRLPRTLRFDPQISQTSGLFVAKFKKMPPDEGTPLRDT